MKTLLCITSVCVAVFSASAVKIVANPDIPVSKRIILPSLFGKYGWQTGLDTGSGPEMMVQFGHDRNRALRAVELFGKPHKNPQYQERIARAERSELPVLGKNYPYFEKLVLPSKAQMEAMNKLPGFLGYRAFNEWGTGADRLIKAIDGLKVNTHVGRRLLEASKTVMKGKKTPKTREEYEQLCRYLWELYNAPFDFETHVFDGSHYWAKAWPGGWNKIRGIITENRTPYRSNSVLQAFTRGAARMWNVPFGYFPAYDWQARISPPMLAHMQKPRAGYQNQQGNVKISPSLYERLYVYMLMGNAAIIADESDHCTYIDLAGKGQYRLSWFGEMCERMYQFNADHDFGVSWAPVALVMSWHNGLVYYGDKAFYRFPYNDGEQMSRELLHRVAYNFQEAHSVQDEFSSTPYGDIFDVLRLDTPKGVIDDELLAAYPVLFLAGEQKFTPEAVAALTGYVRNGGTLILNTAMLKGNVFPAEFLGAEIASPVKKASQMQSFDGKKFNSGKFRYRELKLLPGAKMLYKVGNAPVVSRNVSGKGAVILASPEWMLEEREFLISDVKRKNILPFVHDLVKRISAELIPFHFKGENLDKQLLYQINRKGDNFVIALYNNGGFIYKNLPGMRIPQEIADPGKTLNFSMSVPENIADAVSFTTGEKLYFTRRDGRKMLDFTLEPGAYTVIEVSPRNIPDRVVTRPVNLAFNKKTATDSATPKFGGNKAVDGNESFDSAWWSLKACPQSMTVDLGKIEKVDSCRVVMAWSIDNSIFPRFSQYQVFASADGKDWQLVVDESANVKFDTPMGLHRYFKPVKARYFKINVTYSSSRQGAQVVEFQVFAAGKTQKVTLPWKRDPAKTTFPEDILGMFSKRYLSDMKPVKAIQPEAALSMDKECYRKGPLTIRKREFAKGLGVHAASEVIYQLDPEDNWKMFTANVGLDNSGGNVGTVEFLIYTDGKLAARSGKLTASMEAVPIWADVTNCKELKLVVSDADDGIFGDIADWCDAALRK